MLLPELSSEKDIHMCPLMHLSHTSLRFVKDYVAGFKEGSCLKSGTSVPHLEMGFAETGTLPVEGQ